MRPQKKFDPENTTWPTIPTHDPTPRLSGLLEIGPRGEVTRDTRRPAGKFNATLPPKVIYRFNCHRASVQPVNGTQA